MSSPQNYGSGEGSSGAHQDLKTLWVGDIEGWMDENYIANLFSKVGQVTNAKIIRDKSSGAPIGYGFVEFTSHEIAARVLQLFKEAINPGTNKQFRLNWGEFGKSNKPGDRSSGDRGGGRDLGQSNRNSSNSVSRRPPQTDNTYQIHVSDFDMAITKQQLLDHFKKRYHSVVDAKVVMDNATRISRGYGFVHFTNFEESQKAIHEMNGSLLKGKPLKVNIAVSKNTGGQGSGGRDSRSSSQSNMNQSVLNQIYGGTPAGYGSSPTGGQRGSILGGLGVQFKPNEQLTQPMMAIQPQQYTYINSATVQPLHTAAGYAVAAPGAAQLYAHQLAAASQQGLIYGYTQPTQASLGKMQGSGQSEHMQTGLINADPATLHAFGLSQSGGLGTAGLYQGAHIGMINPQIHGQLGYQFYLPQPGMITAQSQAWTLPQTAREDPSVNKTLKPYFEETPLEIQCNNKLAILHFVQNYDPKTN